jgi:Uncharacterized protein conserved in bacteria (DUF2252)
MSIQSDTRRYEKWLDTQCDVVKRDLRHKHKRMAESAFMFLRATYYRWAGKIEEWCPELKDAPEVLTVGDLHTENFGIWRDKEGRLVWGINDFDEAATMPYAFDLVRLATSAQLAHKLPLTSAQVARAILRGYQRGSEDPRPTLLAEHKAWMRPLVDYSGKASKKFWHKVQEYPKAKSVPKVVAAQLAQSLPRHAEIHKFCTRSVGGGSLGRPRYVAVATWRGGHALREAKAFVPSAWTWAHKEPADPSSFMRLADGRHRSPDPFLETRGKFIYRRIAADSRKIELGEEAGRRLHRALLESMGFDLGAIHAAQPKRIDAIKSDLKERPPNWLEVASDAAVAKVKDDYKSWRKSYNAK